MVVVKGGAWFLGGSNVGGHGVPEAEHRKNNGTRQSVPLPAHLHSWITAASAISASDIWAVTSLGGYVLRWGGLNWRLVKRGGWKAGTRFTGITAFGPRNVWLFGTRGVKHGGAGTWHWTGSGWTRRTGAAADVAQASAAAPNDIWAIGGRGGTMTELLHFAGGTWQRQHPAALVGFRYTHVLALARGNVWVAGSVAGQPKLGHFDGRGWTTVSMPGSTPGTGICRDGRGGLWVIANSGRSPSLVRHRSPAGRWTRSIVSTNRANAVRACALVPGTRTALGAGTALPPPGSSGTAAAVYAASTVP